MAFIPGGYICIARRLRDSDIWFKPSSWLKVWMYILLGVPYDTHTRVFTFSPHDLPDVSVSQWHRCIAWLKASDCITATKTTRGVRITVLHYEVYQDAAAYAHTSTAPAKGPSPAKANASPRTETTEPAAAVDQHPGLTFLLGCTALSGFQPNHWAACIRGLSPHINLLAAATEAAGAAELQPVVTNPAPFVRACFVRYEKAHQDSINASIAAAKQQQRDFDALVAWLRDAEPSQAALREAHLQDHRRRYGSKFIEAAIATGLSTKGQTT